MTQVNTDTTASLLMLGSTTAGSNTTASDSSGVDFEDHLKQAQRRPASSSTDRETDTSSREPARSENRSETPSKPKAADKSGNDGQEETTQSAAEVEEQGETGTVGSSTEEETTEASEAVAGSDQGEDSNDDAEEGIVEAEGTLLTLPAGFAPLRQLHAAEESAQGQPTEQVEAAENSATTQESGKPADAQAIGAAVKLPKDQLGQEQATGENVPEALAVDATEEVSETTAGKSSDEQAEGGDEKPSEARTVKNSMAEQVPQPRAEESGLKQGSASETDPVQETAPAVEQESQPEASGKAKKSDESGNPTARTEPVVASTGNGQATSAAASSQASAAAAATAATETSEGKASKTEATKATSPIDGVKADAGVTAARSAALEGSRGTAASQAGQQGTDVGEAQRMRLVQRVSRAFQAMGNESGTVRLRLSPPELGSLRLEISVRQGVMHARMEVETQAARHALLDNLPALRERLAQQDIRVEQFDIDLSKDSTGGMPRQPSDQPQSDNQSGRRSSQPSGPQAVPATESTEPTQTAPNGGASQLNVVV